MFVSIHIPKTAGTTFRELLELHFGDSLCLYYAGLMNRAQQPIAEFPPHARCVHGHIHAKEFDHLFPDCLRLVWLREPVERLVSEYMHYLRSPDPANELSVLVTQGSGLLEFARNPQARNMQSRLLQYLPTSAFTFMGICEHFDRELVRLAGLTGIRLPPGHRANANPVKPQPQYALPAALRMAILELNQDDVELYRRAQILAGLA